MDLTVHIPDEIAILLNAAGNHLSRRALEVLALGEYKSGHITKPELRRMLALRTRHHLDGFLKIHQVYGDQTAEDVDRELEGSKRLGF